LLYIIYLYNYILLLMSVCVPQIHTSSIPENIEDDDLVTPKAPRGKRSDLTEQDLEEFVRSFASTMTSTSTRHLE
jgi:hypothetical protein